MKKTIRLVLLIILLLPPFPALHLFGETPLPFFGNVNLNIDAETIFAANLENGATGLSTSAGFGLWFEYVPYSDRNITPRRDALSVSLKLSNSAIYAWRGYDYQFMDGGSNEKYVPKPNDVVIDQATSIWFDTFIAQLEYNRYWIRIAGIEPEVSLSQASIRSVFDPITQNRTAIDKNRMYLPLFHTAAHYRPWPNHGIVPVIAQDLVHLNRREVPVAGNVSAGLKSEYADFTLKAGSWKSGEENTENSWIGGFDITLRPDLSNTVNLSFLGAANYGVIDLNNDIDKNDPAQNKEALTENPLAFGLGYEYRFDLPRRMVIKPYAGVDFIYQAKNGEYDFEAGGGLQWFFRGTGAQFKRNTTIGGARIGDVAIPAALVLGMNVNKDGVINGVVSINENPLFSPLPRFGGFLLLELMNINGKPFKAWDEKTKSEKTYNDFLWAGMVQLEYLAHNKIMPYVFARYMPAIMPADLRTDDPVFGKDYITLTSKLGCRFTPIDYFSVDFWYERNDFSNDGSWKLNNGIVSVSFAISL
ncbi:MAG: hypothetical protein LBB72_05325 [Spirochaetaceae bacterium]|jgi:hypothetical protein|nr:hypothetical protein [Spirochaetaceae bacterium]